MTDERKAHALYKECGSWRAATFTALEAHEADKSRHAAELREQAERFSEAAAGLISYFGKGSMTREVVEKHLSPFILAPADPLVELDQIMREAGVSRHVREEVAERIRNGCLAIVKKEAVNG